VTTSTILLKNGYADLVIDLHRMYYLVEIGFNDWHHKLNTLVLRTWRHPQPNSAATLRRQGFNHENYL
ncbi:hypothetical protein, partial [Candidatus Enterovibrio escicola]|uniref:hypothetical protein n=1 Tax=Candidatus Enterovibrio escicola TaxID=1927127 RepID=UPI001CC2A5E5